MTLNVSATEEAKTEAEAALIAAIDPAATYTMTGAEVLQLVDQFKRELQSVARLASQWPIEREEFERLNGALQRMGQRAA